MQATDQTFSTPERPSIVRNLTWFLMVPVVVGVVLSLIVAVSIALYQGRHTGQVYTGVQVWDADLSGMTAEEARTAIAALAPVDDQQTITLVDSGTGREWTYSPADLGLTADVERTVAAAYAVGREGGPWQSFRQQFDSWYAGAYLAPVIVFDEGQFEAALAEIASDIYVPAEDAQLNFDGNTFEYAGGQTGRMLDVQDLRTRLGNPLTDFREMRVELLVHELTPDVLEDPEVAAQVEYLLAPVTFYFQEPLDDVDMDRLALSTEQLASWLRIEMVPEAEGAARYHVFMDENGVRAWLGEVANEVFRPPQNARFYFDDNTRELVLVEGHVNGRALDVEATLDQFIAQVTTPNRSMPLILNDILPTVHSGATATDLGITELVTQTTTWFYGSTPERKHNIARAAAQFFGIVVAPGEEFSFNRYLGDVTEEEGFTTGLVIIGGRTVEGVGGGVCQVSTTLYQAAFWAGFPITERLEHGYRVHYYDDGEGPGMDATVYSPLVDLKFVNNTEHHLLIENYYNEVYEALTFKFYSTKVGRVVEKDTPIFENVVEPNPDVWEFNPDLEEEEIKQVDWAVEGARVTVGRRVFDANGNLMYGQEFFVSNYIPWQNVYQYGPGAELPEGVVPEG
jgi:vancomycin resistance protein YoaR